MTQVAQSERPQNVCDIGPSYGAVTATDPVCGMTVDTLAAKHSHRLDGRTYYFCSGRCREKFIAAPSKYLKSEKSAPGAGVPAGTIYTCPMHPEMRQEGAGICPICGMTLEPEIVTAEAQPNPELADMTRRLWIGLALTLPVFALEMGGHLTGLAPMGRPADLQLGPIDLGNARGVVGWLAVFRARLGVASNP